MAEAVLVILAAIGAVWVSMKMAKFATMWKWSRDIYHEEAEAHGPDEGEKLER